MPKRKALTLGIFCTIIAIGLLLDNVNPCMYPFALAAVLCLGIGIYKYQRDYRIVAQARQAWQADHQIPDTAMSADDADDEAVAHLTAGNITLGITRRRARYCTSTTLTDTPAATSSVCKVPAKAA